MVYRVFGKRLLDIIIVVVAIVILSPLLLIISILIVIFDPGPIFFKQQRIGREAVKFCFYKFRSMPINTNDIASEKVGKIRLTWVGKVIRRTNIDELPQLLNILIGDMSVVGPRPSIPNQQELCKIRIRNKSIRIRPGLTGLAQIKSFDGMSAAKKAEYDCIYANDITFWKDLKIILGTFVYLLKPPPIY